MNRAKNCDRDQGSIIMAMLLIFVGTAMAALLVPLVVTQIHTSSYDYRRSHSLDAAQAGVDVAIGNIRAATDGTSGQLSSLPCSTMKGRVSSGSNEYYSASIYYFSQDPRGHDDWITDTSKQIGCASSNSGLPVTPRYAVIISKGSDESDGTFPTSRTRTVQATYVFRTQNTNRIGGLIHSYGSNPDLCLDAGSSSPSIGATVTFQRCAAGTDQQLWAYNSSLTISLVSTVSGSDLGLCLDAPFTHANNEQVTLQACASSTARDQQWSFTGNNNLQATTSNGTVDSFCWNPQSTNVAGAVLILGSCGGRTTAYAFQPDPSVGAGNALDTGQNFLVNYNQFGRCLDITNNQLPPNDTGFLIAYPCKVTPDTSQTDNLNQRWTLPAVAANTQTGIGQIVSKKDTTFCITSKLAMNSYPYIAKCAASGDALYSAQQWTVTKGTGDYTTSYRLADSARPSATSTIGYCMQPGDPSVNSSYLFTDAQVSKIIVTTCSGATLQKWNAPPGISSNPVKDYREN